MKTLASTAITTPLSNFKIKLIELREGDRDLTVETQTPQFGTEATVLPRDAAWAEYLAQINEHLK